MIFWCIVLLLFSFLSFAIDGGMLPYHIFRHIWNFLLLGLGIFLLLRVKGKETEGFLEHLEVQINDLYNRIEKRRFDVVSKRLDDIDLEISKLKK